MATCLRIVALLLLAGCAACPPGEESRPAGYKWQMAPGYQGKMELKRIPQYECVKKEE